MPDQKPSPPSVVLQAIRLCEDVRDTSRETRILRAALAISELMDFTTDGGVLQGQIEAGNLDGDLREAWAHVVGEHAAGRCGVEEFRVARACLEALQALSGEQRSAAQWLWLRALRYDTWDFEDEPV